MFNFEKGHLLPKQYYMRIKLTLQLDSKPQLLPLNYKYPTSSWIYKILGAADMVFTDMLHEHGYKTGGGKSFKLFTFSDFIVPNGKWEIVGDRMRIWADMVTLIIAFELPEQMQNFITGLFKAQNVVIGDEVSCISMRVKSVEVLNAELPVQDVYTLRWLSPIFVAKKVEGRKYPEYISPANADYSKIFAKNLLDKYHARCLQEGVEPNPISMDDIVFKSLHNKPKSVKQIIKAFKRGQTEIRAFKFNFELKAPKEIVEIGLNAGFGAENAQGFGCCEAAVKY